MTTSTDPLCGCPVAAFAANRRDRRAAERRGQPTPATVTRHRETCPRNGASAVRSSRANDKPRRPQ